MTYLIRKSCSLCGRVYAYKKGESSTCPLCLADDKVMIRKARSKIVRKRKK